MNAKQNRIGFGMLTLSGLFLFNPVVGYVDVLPDAVGFFLLWVGLYRLADLNDKIAEASRRFRILFFIGLGELFVTYLLHVSMPARASQMNVYERPASILLFSFVLLLSRWMLLIPAFRDLFGGLQHLAEKYDGGELLTEKRGKTRIERMIRHSTVFVILQTLLATLPEAAILTAVENNEKWYEFIMLFRVTGAMIATVVSIVWLTYFLSCAFRLLRAEAWRERLGKAYAEEILPQTEMLALRRTSVVFLLFNVAVLFTLNLRVDFYAALPGAVAAILTLISLKLLEKELPSLGKCRAACVGLGAVSLAQIIVNSWFLSRFLPEASLYQTDAYYAFLAVQVLEAAEAIVALIFFYTLLKVVFEWMRDEISVEYTGDTRAADLSQKATARLHREFARRFDVTFILFFAATVANVVDAFLQLDYGWIWLISLAFSFAAVWIFWSLVHDLMSEIKDRYFSSIANKRG
ncbi:MAG: hypothetical protein IKJ35_02605 [Clostridia bacterium]|nr:hypothetical protein [Clostridia bacterium]